MTNSRIARVLMYLLVIVPILLFSCTKKEAVPAEEKQAAETEQAKLDEVTVLLGTDPAGVDDKSFNASAWRGITRFYGDTPENPSKKGKYYDYVTSTIEQYTPTLRLMAEEDYDLLIVAGFTWIDTLNTVAPKYPNKNFVIIDVDASDSGNNVMGFIYAEEQGSFLAGVAAALKAKEAGVAPKFGFIGGIPGAVITHFQVGYMEGILTVSPGAVIEEYYANDWADPAKAKVKSESWFNSGVYAILTAAGSTGNGTLQAAKEQRQNGKDVWAIGVDSDQYEEGIYESGKSAILTSMVKRVDRATEEALTRVKNNSFRGGTIRFDLKVDGVGLPDKNPNLSSEIMNTVSEYKEKVVTGEIVVSSTVKEFTAAGNLGEGMKISALDD